MSALPLLLALLLVLADPSASPTPLSEAEHLHRAEVDFRLGNFERALEEYRLALKRNPRSNTAWRGIGKVYFQQFQWELAAEAYKQAIAIDDKDADAYFYLGKTYFNWRKPKEGIAAFEKYLEVDPYSGYADRVRRWIRTLKEVGTDIDWLI